jgi:gas vesicle protein
MNEKSGCRSDFWLGFILGGVVGGFIALLFTTERGKKIRKKISEEGGDWANQAVDGLNQIVTDLEKKTEKVKEEGGRKITQRFKGPLEKTQVSKKEAKTTSKPSKKFSQTSSRRRFFKKGSKKP